MKKPKEKILVEVCFTNKQYHVKVFDLMGEEIEKLSSSNLRNQQVATSYVERLKLNYELSDVRYTSSQKKDETNDYFTPEYVAHAFQSTAHMEHFLEELFLHKEGFKVKINIRQDSEYLSFYFSEQNSESAKIKLRYLFAGNQEEKDIQEVLFERLFGTVGVDYDVSAKDWGSLYLLIPFKSYATNR